MRTERLGDATSLRTSFELVMLVEQSSVCAQVQGFTQQHAGGEACFDAREPQVQIVLRHAAARVAVIERAQAGFGDPIVGPVSGQ